MLDHALLKEGTRVFISRLQIPGCACVIHLFYQHRLTFLTSYQDKIEGRQQREGWHVMSGLFLQRVKEKMLSESFFSVHPESKYYSWVGKSPDTMTHFETLLNANEDMEV